MNLEFLNKLADQLKEKGQIMRRLFLILGISLIILALTSLAVNILNMAMLSGTIIGGNLSILLLMGILFGGFSQVFYNDPRKLKFSMILIAASLSAMIIYLAISFYVRIISLSSSSLTIHSLLVNRLNNPVLLESLHYFIIASLVIYSVTLVIFLILNRSFKKFSPFVISVGLLFLLILAGDFMGGIMNGDFFQNALLLNGNNILESFVSFSIIIISLAMTIAFISYLFPKVGFLKLFFSLLIMAGLFQAVFFYETSIASGSAILYFLVHGKFPMNVGIRGTIEVCISAAVSYLALEFASSIRNRKSLMELLSIAVPVSGTAFALLIVFKLLGSSVFINDISLNVGSALVLYLIVIITATLSLFLSRTKNNNRGNFSPVIFPLLIMAIPMFGMFSIYNTMNFQISLIYTIIILTSAIFIADTLSMMLSTLKVPVIGKLSISYIVNEEDFNIPEEKETPSDHIIIDDNVKKPIPKYWIGKRIWGYAITEIDDSFDPSFFHLFGVSQSGALRRLSIMVLKQYSSHGVKLAYDNNVIELMNRRFSELIKLKDVKNIQQVLEIHSNSAESYMENQDNYKNAPPVVIMEDVQRRELTSLDWSLGSLKSKQVFRKVINEILSSLEKAHSMGIIHGNISMSSVFIESNARLSEFTNVIGSDQNLDNLILSENIRVKIGGFCGEVFDPHQYKEIFGFIPYYYPPEYLVGNNPATPSWDIYEMSCLLYELLSGNADKKVENRNIWSRNNFIRTKIGNNGFYDTLGQMIGDIERFPIEPLYSINKNISIDLWNIIKKGLNPDPKLRFSRIAEMKESINNVLRENYGLGKDQEIN